MPRLLLIAHAPLASTLLALAQHTYEDCAKRLSAIDVTAGMSADDVEAAARLAMRGAEETLILTDVFGASPCNGVQRLIGPQVAAVSGVNVPMLWRVLCYADQALSTLAERAMKGGIDGILLVPALEQPPSAAADTSTNA